MYLRSGDKEMDSHDRDDNNYDQNVDEELHDNTLHVSVYGHGALLLPSDLFAKVRVSVINERFVFHYKCHCFHGNTIERMLLSLKRPLQTWRPLQQEVFYLCSLSVLCMG